MPKSLNAKWSVLRAIAMSAVPVLAIGTFAYLNAYRTITTIITRDNMGRAGDTANELDRFLEERIGDVQVLGSMRALSDPARSAAEKNEMLSQFVASFPMYEHIVAYDTNGSQIASSDGLPARGRHDQSHAQPPAVLHKVAIQVTEGAVSGSHTIHITGPIFALLSSRIIGSIEAAVDMSQVDRMLSVISTSDESYIVTDQTGEIFVAEDKAYLNKRIDTVFPGLSSAIAGGKGGTFVLDSAGTFKRTLLAYTFTHGPDEDRAIRWGVVIGTDASIAYAPTRLLLEFIIIATILSALLSAGITIWTTRLATDPLLIDIDHRKEIERELAAARDEALALARAKAEFLANMSHEIRTPLNSIIGFAGLMLDDELSEEQRDFMENIRTSGDILLDTINNVLDLSKMSAGKLNLEKVAFDLRPVIESAIDLLAETAQSRKLELVLWIDEKVPAAVLGDPGRLRQVLVNLVTNAVKFTKTGEILVRVKIDSEAAEDALVRFEVIDTGIGIPEEVQRGLFEPFHQADSSTTRKYGGTGLGLAISAQLVELMSGTIGVRSQAGKGSTFWFTVPFTRAASDIVPRTSSELAGIDALVVDDNASNRQIVRHQMESWGMRVDVAADGFRALELMRMNALAKPYALVVIDLQMPGMSGLELASEIKADPALSNTHLVMLSSAGDRREYGARVTTLKAWLTKPIKSLELFRCLSSLPLHDAKRSATPAIVEIGGSSTGTEPHSQAEHQPVRSDGSSTTGRNGRSKGRILVAEDNPINQKVALSQLGRLGYQADAVGNGLEALSALAQIDYDAVLMDCQMPEMDGYTAARELRKREGGGRHTIVIAMTAYGLEEDREKCLDAGMDDYISKPVRMEHLEEVLSRNVSQNATAPA
jgi:signal transduction histidine kinase/CheY-like chemotaxis protein